MMDNDFKENVEGMINEAKDVAFRGSGWRGAVATMLFAVSFIPLFLWTLPLMALGVYIGKGVQK